MHDLQHRAPDSDEDKPDRWLNAACFCLPFAVLLAPVLLAPLFLLLQPVLPARVMNVLMDGKVLLLQMALLFLAAWRVTADKRFSQRYRVAAGKVLSGCGSMLLTPVLLFPLGDLLYIIYMVTSSLWHVVW